MASAYISVFEAIAAAVSCRDTNTLHELIQLLLSQPGISEQALRSSLGTWVLNDGTASWADLLMQAGLNICTLDGDLFNCFATMSPSPRLVEIYRWLCTEYAALGGTMSPIARIAQQATRNCFAKHYTFEWLQVTLQEDSLAHDIHRHVAEALRIMVLAGDLEFLVRLKHDRVVPLPTYCDELKIVCAVRVLQSCLQFHRAGSIPPTELAEITEHGLVKFSQPASYELFVEALNVLKETMGVAWPTSIPTSSMRGILKYATDTMILVAGSAGNRLRAITLLLSFGRDRPDYTEACLDILSARYLLRYCSLDIGIEQVIDFARALFKCSQPKTSSSNVFGRVCSVGAWDVCSLIDLDLLDQADLSQDDLSVLLHLAVTGWVGAGITPDGQVSLTKLVKVLLHKGAYPRSPSWFLGQNAVELAQLMGAACIQELLEANTCCLIPTHGATEAITSGSPASLRCLAARALSCEKLGNIPAELEDLDLPVAQNVVITLRKFIEAHVYEAN